MARIPKTGSARFHLVVALHTWINEIPKGREKELRFCPTNLSLRTANAGITRLVSQQSAKCASNVARDLQALGVFRLTWRFLQEHALTEMRSARKITRGPSHVPDMGIVWISLQQVATNSRLYRGPDGRPGSMNDPVPSWYGPRFFGKGRN